MSQDGVDLGAIPPEALEGVKTGKISLADIFSGIVANFNADYESLLSDKFQSRVREEGFTAIVQALNEGNLVLVIACLVATIFLMLFFQETFLGQTPRDVAEEEEEEEARAPPRDFTLEQLRDFDGVKNEKIYIAMKGEVYDVSDAKSYYGVDSSYHCFAGRDASRAMAKLSFDEEELSNQNLDDLGIFEKDVLQNWIDKFKYSKQYPIVGHLSFPKVEEKGNRRVFTVAELAKFKGICPPKDGVAAVAELETVSEPTGDYQALLPGRVSREILMCVRGKVFDVSYGGVEMYGEGGPYHRFAGTDASRALAKMSFDAEDLASRDLSDLTESQRDVLNDWEKKYQENKKYPVVGVMEGAEEEAAAALYVIPENMRAKASDVSE